MKTNCSHNCQLKLNYDLVEYLDPVSKTNVVIVYCIRAHNKNMGSA